MKDIRPINLDLGSLKYPPMAIASILHRLSGLLMFLLLPVMLYYLGMSLRSSASFDALHLQLNNPWTKLVLWAFGSAWVYHVLAGIRHILMDLGLGEHLATARKSAVLILVLAVISTTFLGIWVW